MSALDIAARDDRYWQLIQHYGPVSHRPAVEDLGDARYVLVQNFGWVGFARAGVAFVVCTDLWELLEWARSEVLHGWIPEKVYDLSDGSLIGLHVTTPVVSVAKQQGIATNPLDPTGVTG